MSLNMKLLLITFMFIASLLAKPFEPPKKTNVTFNTSTNTASYFSDKSFRAEKKILVYSNLLTSHIRINMGFAKRLAEIGYNVTFVFVNGT